MTTYTLTVEVDDQTLVDLLHNLHPISWYAQAVAAKDEAQAIRFFDQESDEMEPPTMAIDAIVAYIESGIEQGYTPRGTLDGEIVVLTDNLQKADERGTFKQAIFVQELYQRGVFRPDDEHPVYTNGLDWLNETVDEVLQLACFGEVLYG